METMEKLKATNKDFNQEAVKEAKHKELFFYKTLLLLGSVMIIVGWISPLISFSSSYSYNIFSILGNSILKSGTILKGTIPTILFSILFSFLFLISLFANIIALAKLLESKLNLRYPLILAKVITQQNLKKIIFANIVSVMILVGVTVLSYSNNIYGYGWYMLVAGCLMCVATLKHL